jgi:hypothetical protein
MFFAQVPRRCFENRLPQAALGPQPSKPVPEPFGGTLDGF